MTEGVKERGREAAVVALILATATTMGCAAATARPTQAPEVPRLSVDEAREALAADRAIAVDVRPLASYLRSRIKGARSLPYSEVLTRMDELPRDKLIVTYCR